MPSSCSAGDLVCTQREIHIAVRCTRGQGVPGARDPRIPRAKVCPVPWTHESPGPGCARCPGPTNPPGQGVPGARGPRIPRNATWREAVCPTIVIQESPYPPQGRGTAKLPSTTSAAPQTTWNCWPQVQVGGDVLETGCRVGCNDCRLQSARPQAAGVARGRLQLFQGWRLQAARPQVAIHTL
jgi:hypothetical protein